MKEIIKDLNKLKNPNKAKILQRFFKTKKGEYGEGDIFIGITMPKQREIAKKHVKTDLKTIQKLLNSKIHEHRMTALLILTYKFEKSNSVEKKEIFDLYIKNYFNINNWDLVDVSAHKIIGKYLLNKNRKSLFEFANSNNLWKKRISIVATFTFIKNNDYSDTLKISKILLKDKHDLIHKATGWMLREVGKKDQVVEENFLKKHYKIMPRTMLRYAIEKFEETKRKKYLKGLI